jgi:hypothetical protein
MVGKCSKCGTLLIRKCIVVDGGKVLQIWRIFDYQMCSVDGGGKVLHKFSKCGALLIRLCTVKVLPKWGKLWRIFDCQICSVDGGKVIKYIRKVKPKCSKCGVNFLIRQCVGKV